MGRRRRYSSAPRAIAARLDALDLALGPSQAHWPDATWEELFAAAEVIWPRLRDEVMAISQPGSRPWAWWAFEAREPQPAYGDQVQRLLELGELDDREQDELLAIGADAIERYGLALRCHGQHPGVQTANVVLRWRGLPEHGFREDTLA